MTATFYVGDAIQVMDALPENSVDLVLTSPPFLALRSYLPQDHPDKALEGGSQATPGAYIDWLLEVVEACARVLAPHGSLCFELGDTYSGKSGWDSVGPDMGSDGHRTANESADWRSRPNKPADADGWPLAKSLSLIPETFRWAMVYGHNPHTGRTTPPWRLRNVIRWVRPNPPVGALGDKFRPATSELMVFCKAKDRFFDLDAVREPHGRPPEGRALQGRTERWSVPGVAGTGRTKDEFTNEGNPAGAPPLDWWNIPLLEGEEETRYGPKAPQTREEFNARHNARYSKPGGAYEGKAEGRDDRQSELGPTRGSALFPTHPLGSPPLDWWNIPPGGYPGAHYAVWPPELLVKPIKAMCPESVCRVCGEARRRIVENLTDDRRPAAPSAAELGGYLRSYLKQPVSVVAAALGVPETQASHYFRTDPGARLPNPDIWLRLKTILNLGGEYDEAMSVVAAEYDGADYGNRSIPERLSGGTPPNGIAKRVTTGFSDCGCFVAPYDGPKWRPGLVLDPFAGSGTTLAVATGHGRDAVGIDLDEKNYELALDRVGPLILERGEVTA